MNTQVFARQVQHYRARADEADPAAKPIAVQQGVISTQYDKNANGGSLRVGKKWWNETLQGELVGSLLFSRKGFLVRPKLTYAWSEAVKLIGGFEYYEGSDKSTYGLSEKEQSVVSRSAVFLLGRSRRAPASSFDCSGAGSFYRGRKHSGYFRPAAGPAPLGGVAECPQRQSSIASSIAARMLPLSMLPVPALSSAVP